MSEKHKKITEYRMYDLPQDMPAILLTGDEWYISSEASSRLHFHNCTEIGFCHSGRGVIELEDKKHLAFNAGDTAVISKHIPHTTYSEKGARSLWSYMFVDFSELLQDALSGGDIHEGAALFNKQDHPNIHYFAGCLMQELENRKAGWRQLFGSVSLSLHYELSRLHNEQSKSATAPGSFMLKSALDYIRDNYMNKISIKELADICRFSESHFRRQFIATMGTSPHDFITETRINRARMLLNTTNSSILTIAGAVGMSSIANFNRNFKKITGQSPREYRSVSSKAGIGSEHIITYKGWMKAEERPDFVAGEDA